MGPLTRVGTGGWVGNWGMGSGGGLSRVGQGEEVCFEVHFEQYQIGGRTDVKW